MLKKLRRQARHRHRGLDNKALQPWRPRLNENDESEMQMRLRELANVQREVPVVAAASDSALFDKDIKEVNEQSKQDHSVRTRDVSMIFNDFNH
jgi:cytochrome c553